MTVYLDLIFLENLFMNLIILFATVIAIKSKVKILRLLISSALGSIYAVILYVGNIKLFSNIFVKILLSIIMVHIAFNPSTLKKELKNLLTFYFISFTFGGVVFTVVYFANTEKLLIYKGALVSITPLKFIIIGGMASLIIIVITLKNLKGRISKKDMFCEITIYYREQFTKIKAIVDTGNFLRDPINKTPVVIVEKEKLKSIIPADILDNLQNIINGKDILLGEYASRIRLIPFSSIGKPNGVLIGIRPDNVVIKFQDEFVKAKNIIIGIYDGSLSKFKQYSGLIGLSIIENIGGKESEYFTNIKG